MKDVTSDNFGILIAYVAPGATALYGLSFFSPVVAQWLGASPILAPTVAGLLYVTVASVVAGVTVSTVRWMVVDRLHALTGLRRPDFNYASLSQSTAAFDRLVRHHYDYYKFHANMLVALVFAYVSRRMKLGMFTAPVGMADVGFVLLLVVFAVGSRNTLRNYYDRMKALLGNANGAVSVRRPRPAKATRDLRWRWLTTSWTAVARVLGQRPSADAPTPDRSCEAE